MKMRKSENPSKKEKKKYMIYIKSVAAFCSFATEVHFIRRDFKVSPLCLYCEKAKMLSE